MKNAIELDASFKNQPRFEQYESPIAPADAYLSKMKQAGFSDPREYGRATLKSGFPHWPEEFIEEVLDRSPASIPAV